MSDRTQTLSVEEQFSKIAIAIGCASAALDAGYRLRASEEIDRAAELCIGLGTALCSKGSRGDSGELEAEQDRLEAQEQERRTGRWIGCGDFEFDCGIDRAVVSVIRDRSDGKPEIETEFEASLQRLIDMRDGAERAIRFLLEGTSDA